MDSGQPANKETSGDVTPDPSQFGSYSDFRSQAELFPGQEKGASKGPENEGKDKEYSGLKRYGGMLLTLLASLSFSIVTLMVKVLKDHGTDQYAASFWRYLGTTLPTIPILAFFTLRDKCSKSATFDTEKAELEEGRSIYYPIWPPWKRGNWKTIVGLLSRGVIGSASVILRYYSLQYLSIGDASVITYATPVLVTVMAHFCLGERCGVIPVIIAFTTMAGVVVVAKPPLIFGGDEEFDQDTMIGVGLALGSLFCASLIVIITRKIREVNFALMLVVFGSIGLAMSAGLALTAGQGHLRLPDGMEESLLVAGVAGLSFLGQMAIVLALKFEQAGPVALLRNCDIVFGFIFQFFVLGVVPDKYSALGGTIVLTGILIIASRKWVQSLPKENCGRKYFGWVLY